MATTHLLYLHGFRSSPQSVKAKRMAAVVARDYPAVTWWCPQLPPSPERAMQDIMEKLEAWPHGDRMAVVGSSLGGFYATWVAERMGCKAVLLNPAVEPSRDLEKYIGEQTSWHDPAETFFFRPEFVDELKALHVGPLKHPENYFALVAKGDEVLDWREMTGRYKNAQIRLLEGGDHALSDFDDHLPALLDFLNLARQGS
ncbi:MAG: YqiA/YcfP family alpha/beta fold hydrolase [Pseudomonadota bacterium]